MFPLISIVSNSQIAFGCVISNVGLSKISTLITFDASVRAKVYSQAMSLESSTLIRRYS